MQSGKWSICLIDAWDYFPRMTRLYVGNNPTSINLCNNFPRGVIKLCHALSNATMNSPLPPSAEPAPSLIQAMRRVLRPLVKLMLASGVTYPYLADLLKALFVEVAEKDFRIDGAVPTDSRVSLVSGVHRKEVNRLRLAVQSDAPSMPNVVSLGAQLVAVWLGNPKYLDENERPRPLARFMKEGGELSFEALVAGVNSDIRPRVVLDEWMRLGVVRFDDEQRVCLNADAFVPTEGFDEKAFYFGHNLHDHAAAAGHNLLGVGAPFMERSVHYDALSTASVETLARQAEKLGMAALVAVNKNALALEQTDTQAGAPANRMTFGIYYFSEPVPPGNEP